MHWTPTKIRPGALLLVGCLALSPSLAGQEVEEEDLPLEPATSEEGWEEIERSFEDAEMIFRSREQDQSIDLFTELISTLDQLPIITEEEAVRIEEELTRALAYRARAAFNFGDTQQARTDIERLLRLQPYYEMDRSEVSSKLLRLFDSMRDGMIGYLEVLPVPSDAAILLGGEPIDVEGGPFAVIADTYPLVVERPGFASFAEDVTVQAGKTKTVEAILERTSAVVILRTWPKDALVLVDGEERGRTDSEPAEDWIPTGDVASRPRQEIGEIVIGGLEIGEHTIEVRKEGYRPFPGRVEITELEDNPLLPLVLELEAGTVVLEGMPPDAVLLANGRPVEPGAGPGGSVAIELPPDDYRLSIRHPSLGIFETRVTVVDQQTERLEVDLRPGLVLMGVLGGDRVGAEKLKTGLAREIESLGQWTVLERSADGPQRLAPLGMTTDRLRELGERGQTTGIDWPAVQEASEALAPGSVYILAVLGDDLVASEADLWIWPSKAGGSRPDLRRLVIEDDRALADIAAAFSPSLDRPHVSLGALFIDSAAAAGPVVAQVSAGGPAAEAGIEVGDEITAYAGTPILTTAQLRQQLIESPAGGELEIRSGSGTRKVEVTPVRSQQVIDLAEPPGIHAALAAEVSAELARSGSQSERWLLELNRAVVLLISGAYEDAVRALRTIRAPAGAPLGQSSVDYLMGVALFHSDARYADRAAESFASAAADDQGRLQHRDGPWVAPRARARLAALGAGTP